MFELAVAKATGTETVTSTTRAKLAKPAQPTQVQLRLQDSTHTRAHTVL